MVDYLKRLNQFKALNSSSQESPSSSQSTETITSNVTVPTKSLGIGSGEENDHNHGSNDSSGGQHNSNHLSSPSATNGKPIELRATVVKKVPLERLVWAPCHNLKGGGAYVCARICDIGEGATEYIDDKKWPMQENEVLVEYFNVPITYLKVDVIPENSTVPYYENPHKHKNKHRRSSSSGGGSSKKRDRSPINNEEDDDDNDNSNDDDNDGHKVDLTLGWNEDGLNELTTIFHKRYNAPQTEKIKNTIIKTANDFLTLALEAHVKAEETTAKDQERVKQMHTSHGNQPVNKSISMKEMSKLVRVRSVNMSPLVVGDKIEYFHKIFRNRNMESEIVSFSRHPIPIIRVKTGDILEENDMVTRGKDSGLVKDFTFEGEEGESVPISITTGISPKDKPQKQSRKKTKCE